MTVIFPQSFLRSRPTSRIRQWLGVGGKVSTPGIVAGGVAQRLTSRSVVERGGRLGRGARRRTSSITRTSPAFAWIPASAHCNRRRCRIALSIGCPLERRQRLGFERGDGLL